MNDEDLIHPRKSAENLRFSGIAAGAWPATTGVDLGMAGFWRGTI